jgi:signal transduction histidine kinase
VKLLRPGDLTVRVRLTLVFGALFFVAGAVLLGITYLLVSQAVASSVDKPSMVVEKGPVGPDGQPWVRLADGRVVSPSDAIAAVAEDQRSFERSTLDTLLTRGGIALAVLGAGGLGLGWIMAQRAMRPVGRITAAARRVAAEAHTPNGLRERIALAGPADEIKELADTFDDMLERLDNAFDAQRRFVANASHELRTPLAINRAMLEVAATRADAPDSTRELAQHLLAVNARHARLIEGLLALADSENPPVGATDADLAELVRHVLQTTDLGGIRVRETDLRPACVHGDTVLLERLVNNLVDNAIRHNVEAGWLEIRTGTTRDRAYISVSNSATLPADADLATIFEPFQRLATDRTGSDRGAGLGLSIVRAVARTHRGDTEAVALPEAGLRVTATFGRRVRRRTPFWPGSAQGPNGERD